MAEALISSNEKILSFGPCALYSIEQCSEAKTVSELSPELFESYTQNKYRETSWNGYYSEALEG
jgi:hypothetical protein